MKKKVKKAVSAMSILGAVVVLGISASLIDNPKWVDVVQATEINSSVKEAKGTSGENSSDMKKNKKSFTPEKEEKDISDSQMPESKNEETNGTQKVDEQKEGSKAEATQTSNTTQTNTTTQTNKGCEHNWVTNYKTESWAAEYGTRKVVDREAYTEDVPVYDMKEINVCNVCKQEITGDPSAHAQAHALAGEGAGHHTEWEKKQVGTKQVQHAEVSHQEPYLIKEAGSRQVADGQKCTKCGAVRR